MRGSNTWGRSKWHGPKKSNFGYSEAGSSNWSNPFQFQSTYNEGNARRNSCYEDFHQMRTADKFRNADSRNRRRAERKRTFKERQKFTSRQWDRGNNNYFPRDDETRFKHDAEWKCPSNSGDSRYRPYNQRQSNFQEREPVSSTESSPKVNSEVRAGQGICDERPARQPVNNSEFEEPRKPREVVRTPDTPPNTKKLLRDPILGSRGTFSVNRFASRENAKNAFTFSLNTVGDPKSKREQMSDNVNTNNVHRNDSALTFQNIPEHLTFEAFHQEKNKTHERLTPEEGLSFKNYRDDEDNQSESYSMPKQFILSIKNSQMGKRCQPLESAFRSKNSFPGSVADSVDVQSVQSEGTPSTIETCNDVGGEQTDEELAEAFQERFDARILINQRRDDKVKQKSEIPENLEGKFTQYPRLKVKNNAYSSSWHNLAAPKDEQFQKQPIINNVLHYNSLDHQCTCRAKNIRQEPTIIVHEIDASDLLPDTLNISKIKYVMFISLDKRRFFEEATSQEVVPGTLFYFFYSDKMTAVPPQFHSFFRKNLKHNFVYFYPDCGTSMGSFKDAGPVVIEWMDERLPRYVKFFINSHKKAINLKELDRKVIYYPASRTFDVSLINRWLIGDFDETNVRAEIGGSSSGYDKLNSKTTRRIIKLNRRVPNQSSCNSDRFCEKERSLVNNIPNFTHVKKSYSLESAGPSSQFIDCYNAEPRKRKQRVPYKAFSAVQKQQIFTSGTPGFEDRGYRETPKKRKVPIVAPSP